MEPTGYQENALKDISDYMERVNESDNLFTAWKEYWLTRDIIAGEKVPAYRNTIPGVPHICSKVPTGGGKTFLACAALRRIFDALPSDKRKFVVWLVPSDSILKQTVRALSDVGHPYRRWLETDFLGRVGVYTKEQLLMGQQFSPDIIKSQLTVCIMTYATLRIDSKKKDVRKVYQENGYLLSFTRDIENRDALLPDTPETALIQALRRQSPVVVVDESHNAGSELSAAMLKNLNPSFILDLTATPRKESNIITYVDARELKKENMVKLPVIVYNRTTRQSVIQDAIDFRGTLERQAREEESDGGIYIRPIVLFQAQPNTGKEAETYRKIRSVLINDYHIPESEIAVKTSETDDLKDTNLISRDCPIRYIITVNALKEGWDCPFAYILASLANKTSSVDVEQIVGRILRQPYPDKGPRKAPLLNSSYVFTCSRDFHDTLENIVKGLNRAGFSRKDYRVADNPPPEQPPVNNGMDQLGIPDNPPNNNNNNNNNTAGESGGGSVNTPPTNDSGDDFDNFDDVSPAGNGGATGSGNADGGTAVNDSGVTGNADSSEMEQQAERQVDNYNDAQKNGGGSGAGGLDDMRPHYAMQIQFQEDAEKLCIPQFFLKSVPDLFGGEYDILEKENLSGGFSLSGQDAQISFELSAELYRVDLQEKGDAVPKYKRASKTERERFAAYLASLPEERRVNACIDSLCERLNRNNRISAKDITNYVKRIVDGMSENELTAMETAFPVYAQKIQEKIDALEYAYREKQFYKWLDNGKIVCRESWSFPSVITPAETISSVEYSLYEAEKNDMNQFELRVLDALAGLPNILWWHRNIERNREQGFRLNGPFNHYPDFIIRMRSGLTLLVEAKGDDRDNSDSLAKLRLGKAWQTQSGAQYRYFMVFDHREVTGAYTLDAFVEMAKEL